MTAKMREVIQQAGYRFCTHCWESGTEPRKPYEYPSPFGRGLPKPCTVCHGDGIVKEAVGGVPIT